MVAHYSPKYQVILCLTNLLQSFLCSHGTLVVKETDSRLACHEFEPSTAEDPPCRAAMHVKSFEAKTSSRWCGVEVWDVTSQVSSSSLGHGSK
ncbi:hypothetical protein TNCV_4426351 [Trichonephila clavipes]|nr:hypothetical protein TNCV_4426351 [Trichonephila clavipes]